MQGRIEYFFKTFGAIATLFVEMKLKFGNDKERLEAIAQVIAESDGTPHAFTLSDADLLTVQAVTSTTPLMVFLHLSTAFYPTDCPSNFSLLKERQTPLFSGCFPGDPKYLRRGLKIPDFLTMDSSLPFILQLRCVCETIFDVMLSAYIAGLKAYHDQSNDRGKQQVLQRPSFDAWDRASIG
jgi:hypothetical protein